MYMFFHAQSLYYLIWQYLKTEYVLHSWNTPILIQLDLNKEINRKESSLKISLSLAQSMDIHNISYNSYKCKQIR